MDSLIQEIGKQSSECLQILLASLQLEAKKRGLISPNPPSNPLHYLGLNDQNCSTPTSGGSSSTPQDKPPNGHPPNSNPPYLPNVL